MHTPTPPHFHLLKQLVQLAQEQRTALQSDQIQRFSALLDRRQELIDTLQGSLGEPVPDNVIPFPGLAEPEEDTIALEALVRRILEIDQENGALLRTKREQVASSLRKLHQGRQAARGYAVPRTVTRGLEKAG